VLSGKSGAGRMAFVAEVRSLAHVLGQTVGRTFQAGCDASAWAMRAAASIWKTPSTRARASSPTSCATGRSWPRGSGFSGTLTWTSGANAGRVTEVLAHGLDGSIATLTLLEAPVRAIAEGDSFIARAGCDKRIATCSAKFANVANFRGFPNIPGQDAVLRYASQDGGHEGNVL
jgi:uncharacterized phage protein (TIGR02218 family)